MTVFDKLVSELKNAGSPDDGVFAERFFKTGKGEYGEGDKFLGIRMPVIRKIAKNYYQQLTIKDLDKLLNNEWHEVRMTAVIAMTIQYKKSSEVEREALYKLYLAQTGKGINNWDLVDVTCAHIVGPFLYDKNRQPLFDLAATNTGNTNYDLWNKRVSIISTFYFLRNGDLVDTYNLAEILVDENHDLMHKAVGWSLREMGKTDDQLLYKFLNDHAATMPRTALRYSLERTPKTKKDYFMGLKNNAS